MNSTLLKVKYLLVNRLILRFNSSTVHCPFSHQIIWLSMAVLSYLGRDWATLFYRLSINCINVVD